eukprot:6471231-Amphidinium_carterae.1
MNGPMSVCIDSRVNTFKRRSEVTKERSICKRSCQSAGKAKAEKRKLKETVNLPMQTVSQNWGILIVRRLTAACPKCTTRDV